MSIRVDLFGELIMLIYRKEFCPQSTYDVYPPYADGAYLEDYFSTRFFSEGVQLDMERQFIPILWTPYYLQETNYEPLQRYLDSLDRNGKYFLVSQHDDAPKNELPPDTWVFSAGGNYEGPNTIPIPLICSPIELSHKENRDIFVSFVGSNTHPLRAECFQSLHNKNGVYLDVKNWNPAVSAGELDTFRDITSRSVFSLCPRGYGKSSFRMYESMQMGTIPVYVSDNHYTPWLDELDWNDFSVIIKQNEIPNLYEILSSVSQEDINKKRDKLKEVYPKYFSMHGVYNNIMKRLKNK